MAYTPTSMTTATPGLAHVQQILYKKKALDRLQKKFIFRQVCDPDVMPLNSGRTAQWYRWDNLAANTVPTTEGTVGTGLTISSNLLTATVSQFSNFISLSDFVVETAPDGLVGAAAELLGYRAGLTVDTLTRLVIDKEFTSVSQPPGATYLRLNDLRTVRHLLQGVDVQPFEGNQFFCISHPYNTYDVLNDPNVLGYPDSIKYTDKSGGAMNNAPDRGHLVDAGHCMIYESTNVATSGSNRYTYIFGKGAVGTLDLEGRGPSKVVDPRKERFSIITRTSQGGALYDPEGVIGATVAYNFKTTAIVKEGPAPIGGTYRFKIISAPSTIA